MTHLSQNPGKARYIPLSEYKLMDEKLNDDQWKLWNHSRIIFLIFHIWAIAPYSTNHFIFIYCDIAILHLHLGPKAVVTSYGHERSWT